MPTGSLDRWADDYERGRPGSPPAVVDVAGLPPAACVVELGAGTGKLTRLLVRAFGRVLAVEPTEAMRRLLATLCPARPGRGGRVFRVNGRLADLPDEDRLPLLDEVAPSVRRQA